ncbi:MAG: thiolase family protein [Polyangia bacterium]|jgi:acetyl-CoA acyltransferase|nr:thiolase family protein [Polyangia bacterium]
MREAVIVAACRTAAGKANRGSLIHTRPDDMAGVVLAEVVKRAGIKPELVEDVVLGCAMPEAEQGMNLGRIAVHLAGFPDEVPAMTVNRFCSSGLQTIWNVATDIMAGMIDVGIAGGAETMTMIPMGGNKIVPNIKLGYERPGAYSSMGQTAENVAVRHKISREDQDKFGLDSNLKAAAAIKEGRFKEQIVPLPTFLFDGKGGKKEFVYDTDEGPRADATIEGMQKLKPAFANPAAGKEGAGTVTAANSSQMSDGAAALLLMSREKADELKLKPLAKIHGYKVMGVEPEYMGMGPSKAIPALMEKMGKKLGITLDDIGVFEINEAFASQAIACCRILGIDGDPRVNPNGGAIALGHPLGCTGAKLSTQLIYHMRDKNLRYGIVSMCIGGGMGAAGLFENLQYKA